MIGSEIRALRFDPPVLAASFACNLLALATPLLILHVFDRVIPNAAGATLATFAAAAVAVALADYALRLARGHLVAVAGFRFEVETHRRALARVLHPGADLALAGADDLADRFASIGRVRRHYGGEAAMALLDLPFVLLFLTALALISPALGGVAAALAVGSAAIVWLHRGPIIALGHARLDRDRRRHAFLAETLEGFEAIRGMGAEPAVQRRYERMMSASVPLTRDLVARIGGAQGLTASLALAAPAVLATVGAALAIEGRMTVGGLAAGVLLTARVIQPVLRLEALAAGERDVRPALADVLGLLGAPRRSPGLAPAPAIETVELRGVRWTPPGAAEPVLRGVDLSLRRGDCVAIEGADGAGRTTLLSLIAGFLTPEAGEIRIDGAPLAHIDPAEMSRRIRILSPDHTLLHGTLLENLTAFRPAETQETALALARDLGIDRFIAQHPDGLGLKLSARGGGALPKSVQDAVLIVSALADRPDVILFDEANVGLDHRADAALRALLARLKPETILVLVTYRPSLQALADRRCRLEGGVLVPVPAGRTELAPA